ncbi:putative methyltransferase [Sulfolobales Beppu virus 1]|nr:putative methyltransferase [Sulfolobales Beppu virus 1]
MNLVDYFRDMGCDYFHEYSEAYGKLSVKNRSVTIVGGDCGSSALYFLLRGAKKIVSFEKQEKLNQLFLKVCKDFGICDKVEVHGEWHGQYPQTDILVVDCEGCEKDLDVNQLNRYKEYCIAIHEWTENRVQLMKKLETKNLIFTYITNDGKEIMLCKLDNIYMPIS